MVNIFFFLKKKKIEHHSNRGLAIVFFFSIQLNGLISFHKNIIKISAELHIEWLILFHKT